MAAHQNDIRARGVRGTSCTYLRRALHGAIPEGPRLLRVESSDSFVQVIQGHSVTGPGRSETVHGSDVIRCL